jgi:hypothetical protein
MWKKIGNNIANALNLPLVSFEKTENVTGITKFRHLAILRSAILFYPIANKIIIKYLDSND